MLVVLAEFNCIEALNKRGVYPDKFFTDFDLFKKVASTFHDTHVLFILAGTSRFNKRLVTDLGMNLQKRAHDVNDNGIKSFTLLCDTTYVKIKPYFKYRGTIDHIDRWELYNKVEEDIDFWSLFQTYKRESEMYLTKVDNNDTDDFVKVYKANCESSSEDKLIKFIKVPDVKRLMHSEEGKIVGQ